MPAKSLFTDPSNDVILRCINAQSFSWLTVEITISVLERTVVRDVLQAGARGYYSQVRRCARSGIGDRSPESKYCILRVAQMKLNEFLDGRSTDQPLMVQT